MAKDWLNSICVCDVCSVFSVIKGIKGKLSLDQAHVCISLVAIADTSGWGLDSTKCPFLLASNWKKTGSTEKKVNFLGIH